ncbi:hypothetical protein Q604_UNBc4C00204G0001, partial [human gut metagenome]
MLRGWYRTFDNDYQRCVVTHLYLSAIHLYICMCVMGYDAACHHTDCT